MATKSLATAKEKRQEYQLPETIRRQILQESSTRPDKSIPAKKLEIVEQQRLRFVKRFGSDSYGD